MSRLKKLQDRQAGIVATMRQLSAVAETEDRDLTDDEKTQFSNLEQELSRCDAELKIEEAILSNEKKLTRTPTSFDNGQLTLPDQPPRKPDNPRQAITARPRYRGNLQSCGFDGADAEESAYRAGMWLRGVVFHDANALSYCREHCVGGLESLATSSAHNYSNTAGGVFVPDELSAAIIRLREQFGVFRQYARMWPMSSDTLTIPRSITDLTVYAVTQNSDTTASQATWDAVQLVAKEWACLTRLPRDLAEDAIVDLAMLLAQSMGYAFAKKEDEVGFTGDGTSAFHGCVGIVTKLTDGNHNAGVVTAATGNTSFETLSLTDFHNVCAKLPQYARANAKWCISSAGFCASMERLMYAAGGNTVSTIGGGTGPSFLGYPVVISQVLNSTLGSDPGGVACLFGDLSLAAAVGSRRDFRLDSNDSRYFEFRQIALQAVTRADFVTHDVGSNTVAGPVVCLKKAAS